MAHELDFSTGRAAIALRGGAQTAWHRFGEEILPSDGPEEIARKAGLAWTLSLRPVYFQDTDGTMREIADQRATVRLDTRAALGIVSADRFHIDQPADVLEFFREELAAASYRRASKCWLPRSSRSGPMPGRPFTFSPRLNGPR